MVGKALAGLSLLALLAVVVVFLPGDAEASHMRGGTLYFEPNGTANTGYFEGLVQWRWSYYGSPAVGTLAAVDNIDWGDGTSTVFGYKVIYVDAGEDWMITEIVSAVSGFPTGVNHTFPADRDGSDPWYAQFTQCCRNDRVDTGGGPTSHINNPSADQTLHVQVDLTGNNSSPRVFLPPIVACKIDAVCTIPVPHHDPDGDPVTFRWSTDIEAVGEPPSTMSDRIPFFYQPGEGGLHAPNAATINPTNGTITWDTTGATRDGAPRIDLYSAQFMASDGKAQVPMDFFIELTDEEPPYWVTPPSPCGDTVQIRALTTGGFTVEAAHVDSAVTLFRSPTTPLPAGATSPIGPPANPVSSTFTWTPALADIGRTVPITYFAHVGSAYAPQCTVTVEVLDVNKPPVADFECHAVERPYLQVAYRDRSTDPDGTVVAWDWDFGDGKTSTDQHPVHDHPSAGAYVVTLNVTDDLGLTDEITRTCEAVTNLPPEIQDVPDQVVYEGEELRFFVSGHDPEGDPVAWSMGGAVPPGATFKDQWFTWRPYKGLAGLWGPVTFTIHESTLDGRVATVSVMIRVIGPGPPTVPVQGDADGDGVADGQDACAAETGVGFDGCPLAPLTEGMNTTTAEPTTASLLPDWRGACCGPEAGGLEAPPGGLRTVEAPAAGPGALPSAVHLLWLLVPGALLLLLFVRRRARDEPEEEGAGKQGQPRDAPSAKA